MWLEVRRGEYVTGGVCLVVSLVDAASDWSKGFFMTPPTLTLDPVWAPICPSQLKISNFVIRVKEQMKFWTLRNPDTDSAKELTPRHPGCNILGHRSVVPTQPGPRTKPISAYFSRRDGSHFSQLNPNFLYLNHFWLITTIIKLLAGFVNSIIASTLRDKLIKFKI